MRASNFLAASSLFLLFSVGPALASDTKPAPNMDKTVKMVDADKDGMVSKAEFMKHAEKMWDKMDAKKMGKMDSKQFELFLKSLMMSDG
ncbi:MAG: hypothetical protein SF172_14760 [Burkholderiales bacterium]|nr:hypothetical protein [Burkholderiales bacterium]